MKSTTRRSLSNEAALQATGRTLTQWFAILDRCGAKKMKHPDIAIFLSTKYQVRDWWCQMVTVEYEYARNMRTRNLPRMHADLKTALTKHSKAARTFLEIPPSHRREYLQYVAEAKKPETRQRRIARIIKMLSAWKKKSSK